MLLRVRWAPRRGIVLVLALLLADQQHLLPIQIEVLVGNHITESHGALPVDVRVVGREQVQEVPAQALTLSRRIAGSKGELAGAAGKSKLEFEKTGLNASRE